MKHQLEATKCGRQNAVAVERTTELARYLAVVNNFKPRSIDEEVIVELDKPKSKENGDYATNVAMKLAKSLKKIL